MTSSGHQHRKVIYAFAMPKVVKIVLPGTIFINYFCIPEICQMHRETTINDKNNTKVIAKLRQVHLKDKITKQCENIPFI